MFGFKRSSVQLVVILAWLLRYYTFGSIEIWCIVACGLSLAVVLAVTTYDHDYWTSRGVFSPPAWLVVGHIPPNKLRGMFPLIENTAVEFVTRVQDLLTQSKNEPNKNGPVKTEGQWNGVEQISAVVNSEKLVGGYTADAIVPCAFGLKKTLRLYPPFPSIQRMCTKEYTIPDTNIVVKRGTIVLFHRGMNRSGWPTESGPIGLSHVDVSPVRRGGSETIESPLQIREDSEKSIIKTKEVDAEVGVRGMQPDVWSRRVVEGGERARGGAVEASVSCADNVRSTTLLRKVDRCPHIGGVLKLFTKFDQLAIRANNLMSPSNFEEIN
ncbi:unnamed protein product [Spodoptera littoralis]|uniref:Uncharacterized protein n=1 Tax=Spodoptera littoralis TaxID=7109 RepID=A0A9P0MXX2_SPOLI|nr:unnamed protein product [Spodoptera littoralis]CAH1637457.1 unnamed protein product [Spodoptera littoralis]